MPTVTNVFTVTLQIMCDYHLPLFHQHGSGGYLTT